jgi:hypothetical protein
LKRNLLDSLLCDCNLEGTKIICSTKSSLLYQKILSRDQSNFFNKKFLTLPKQKNNNMRGQVNFFEAKFLLLHPYTNINHGNQNNFASSKNLLGIKGIFSAKNSFALSLYALFRSPSSWTRNWLTFIARRSDSVGSSWETSKFTSTINLSIAKDSECMKIFMWVFLG